MADEFLTEEEVLQALQISKGELDQLVAENKLPATEEGGERRFNKADVDGLKKVLETRATIMAGGIDLEEFDIVEDASLGGYMTIDDAKSTLQCSQEEIDQFISEGSLTPIRDAGTLKFQVADVKRLHQERQERATEIASEDESITYDQAIQELQCGREEIDKLIADGTLTPFEEEGVQKFSAGQVEQVRKRRQRKSTVMESLGEGIEGAAMSADEVVQELGISSHELEQFVAEGKLTATEQDGRTVYDPGEVYLLRRQLRPSTVIEGVAYVDYDQALQDLQTSRNELDRLVAEGLLKPYRDEEGVKFRKEDIDEAKRTLEQKATVLEKKRGSQVMEGTEDLFLIDEEAESVTLDSVLMGEQRAQAEEPGSKVDVGAAAGAEADVDQTGVIPVSESPETAEEESIFDFGEEDLDLDSSDSSVVDIKVEAPSEEIPPEQEPSSNMLEIGSGLGLDADESGDLIQIDEEIASSEILPLEEESDESSADSDIMTDVLQVGEEESSQDDILGDLLEIEEEPESGTGLPAGAAAGFEETVDISETSDVTADITQLDEETYEGTDLSEVLGTEEEVSELYEEPPIAAPEEQFAPGAYVAPAGYAEPAVIGGGWVLTMVVVLVFMIGAGMLLFAQTLGPNYAPGFADATQKIVKKVGLM
jgi:excisionase family DNA binding protein